MKRAGGRSAPAHLPDGLIAAYGVVPRRWPQFVEATCYHAKLAAGPQGLRAGGQRLVRGKARGEQFPRGDAVKMLELGSGKVNSPPSTWVRPVRRQQREGRDFRHDVLAAVGGEAQPQQGRLMRAADAREKTADDVAFELGPARHHIAARHLVAEQGADGRPRQTPAESCGAAPCSAMNRYGTSFRICSKSRSSREGAERPPRIASHARNSVLLNGWMVSSWLVRACSLTHMPNLVPERDSGVSLLTCTALRCSLRANNRNSTWPIKSHPPELEQRNHGAHLQCARKRSGADRRARGGARAARFLGDSWQVWSLSPWR